MLEDFIYAFSNFKRNKIRTVLSLLGIIIGVASVIVIMSMGSSSTKQVADTFGSCGLDMISINTGFMLRRSNPNALQYNESFREELFDSLPGIKKVWYKNSISGTIACNDTSASSQCMAVEPGYIETYGIKLESGELFSVTDDVYGLQKIILGSDISSSLFPNGNAIGKNVTITIEKVPFNFTVCGILKEQNSGMENASTACFIPRGFYLKQVNPNANANGVMVQAVSNDKASELVPLISSFCDNKSRTENSVNISSMQTMIEQISSVTKTMSVMLSGIAAISLLVGGIGIMNIMIVTVTERKQEIGIRKALGASPSMIRQQFLIESASITLIGGFAGIILGIILSFTVEFVMSLSYVISYQSCIIAFFFSVVVGIVFGLSPASRAAKLDPVIALSGE